MNDVSKSHGEKMECSVFNVPNCCFLFFMFLVMLSYVSFLGFMVCCSRWPRVVEFVDGSDFKDGKAFGTGI